MNHDDELKQHVTKQIDRMQQAEKERPTLLAHATETLVRSARPSASP